MVLILKVRCINVDQYEWGFKCMFILILKDKFASTIPIGQGLKTETVS